MVRIGQSNPGSYLFDGHLPKTRERFGLRAANFSADGNCDPSEISRICEEVNRMYETVERPNTGYVVPLSARRA